MVHLVVTVNDAGKTVWNFVELEVYTNMDGNTYKVTDRGLKVPINRNELFPNEEAAKKAVYDSLKSEWLQIQKQADKAKQIMDAFVEDYNG